MKICLTELRNSPRRLIRTRGLRRPKSRSDRFVLGFCTIDSKIQRREKEREEADRRLAEAEGKLQSVEQGLQVAATEILQLKATLQKEGRIYLDTLLTLAAEKTDILKKQFLELKATLDLVKNAAENMQKLQVIPAKDSA
jgi:hypothetical protein